MKRTDFEIFQLALILLIACLITGLSYLLIIGITDNFDPENAIYPTLDDELLAYYDEIPTDSILFLGTSQFKYGLNATQVEEELLANNDSVPVYNLARNNDIPLRRIIELNKLIERKPRMVIMSSSWYQYGNYLTYDSILQYVARHTDELNNDSGSMYTKQYFSQRQLDILNPNYISQFIGLIAKYRENIKADTLNTFQSVPFISGIFETKSEIRYKEYSPIPQATAEKKQRTKDSWEQQIEYITSKYGLAKLENAYDPNDYSVEDTEKLRTYRWVDVPPEITPNKEAFQYFIKKLEENNIPVIIIHMPLDPVLSAMTPESTRNNYFTFLNSTGVHYLNYEARYSPDYIAGDFVHLNSNGRELFSSDMAELIRKELN